jgi:hypothetical protein
MVVKTTVVVTFNDGPNKIIHYLSN